MKRIIAVVAASATCVSLVGWGSARKKSITLLPVVHAEAPKGCSLETVAGNWGFTLTGSAILPTGPVLVAAVGRFTADELDRLRLGPISIKERSRTVGGVLTVESNPGHGARLTIEVPLG